MSNTDASCIASAEFGTTLRPKGSFNRSVGLRFDERQILTLLKVGMRKEGEYHYNEGKL